MLCWVVYNGLDTKVLSQSLAARLMLDKRRRRRMDTHAALQSEQDFHLTRHINPGLLDIFSVMFRFSRHTTPPSHHWLVFEGKWGIKTHTEAGQKGQKATNIGLRIIYAGEEPKYCSHGYIYSTFLLESHLFIYFFNISVEMFWQHECKKNSNDWHN